MNAALIHAQIEMMVKGGGIVGPTLYHWTTEQTDAPLRHFAKGTDLRLYNVVHLRVVESDLSERPRRAQTGTYILDGERGAAAALISAGMSVYREAFLNGAIKGSFSRTASDVAGQPDTAIDSTPAAIVSGDFSGISASGDDGGPTQASVADVLQAWVSEILANYALVQSELEQEYANEQTVTLASTIAQFLAVGLNISSGTSRSAVQLGFLGVGISLASVAFVPAPTLGAPEPSLPAPTALPPVEEGGSPIGQAALGDPPAQLAESGSSPLITIALSVAATVAVLIGAACLSARTMTISRPGHKRSQHAR